MTKHKCRDCGYCIPTGHGWAPTTYWCSYNKKNIYPGTRVPYKAGHGLHLDALHEWRCWTEKEEVVLNE